MLLYITDEYLVKTGLAPVTVKETPALGLYHPDYGTRLGFSACKFICILNVFLDLRGNLLSTGLAQRCNFLQYAPRFLDSEIFLVCIVLLVS